MVKNEKVVPFLVILVFSCSVLVALADRCPESFSYTYSNGYKVNGENLSATTEYLNSDQ